MTPTTSLFVRVAVVLTCGGVAACGYDGSNRASAPVVPERVTAGSGGGAAALHNQVDVGVTTRTSPPR